MYPDLAIIRAMEASALAGLGRCGEVETVVDECLNQPLRIGDAGSVMVEAAAELSAHGHRQEALAMARRAVAWYRALPDDNEPRKTGFTFAGALYRAEEWRESARIYALLADKRAGSSAEVVARGQLGVIAAAQGDRDSAVRISEELTRLRRPYLFGQDTFWRALIAAQLGQKDEAVTLLRTAVSEGYTPGWLSYTATFERSPPLESLRGYPPYEELVKPKG